MDAEIFLREKFNQLGQRKLFEESHSFNSSGLQEKFPQVYKNLFSNCAIVCSSPVVISWTGKGSVHFGGLGIASKLPLRSYVGIESIGTQSFEIGSYVEYDSEAQIFRSKSSQELKSLNWALKQSLPIILAEINGYKKKFPGFRIHILSEYYGLDKVALITALVTSLFLYLGKIRPKDINLWSKTKTEDLIQKSVLQFDQVFRLAWKLYSSPYLGGPVSSGIEIFTSLVSSKYPLVYRIENKINLINEELGLNGFRPKGLEKKLRLIEKVKYEGYRLEEICSFEEGLEFGLDLGLIYPGKKAVKTETYSLSKAKYRRIINLAKDLPQVDFPDLVGELAAKNEQDLILETAKFLNHYSLSIWGSIKKLAESNFQDFEAQLDLFRAINFYREITEALVGRRNEALRLCYRVLRNLAQQIDLEADVAVKETCSAKGERILFLAPAGLLENALEEALIRLRKITGQNFLLEYASWKDGWGEEGIRLEQDLKKQVYSSFISPGSYFVKIFREDGYVETKVISQEEYEKISPRFDLVLDNWEKKIYFRGQPSTSKEVHSTLATLNIFLSLLKQQNRWVSSSSLPFRTYSQNRYEFQSKIISKLKAAIYKHSKKELKIQTSGKIYDFKVKYTPCLNICLVKEKV